MEIYKLAMFIFILNFTTSLLSPLNIVTTTPDNYFLNGTSSKITDNDIKTVLEQQGSGGDKPVLGELIDTGQYLSAAISLFFKMLYYTTMGLPNMLSSEPFNFPPMIVLFIITTQVIIYGVGIASFLRGVVIK